MITIYKYSFSHFIGQNISKITYFSVSQNLGKYAVFDKSRFFSETKKLTVGKILDLYTINRALSNAPLKCSSYLLLFFSIFYVKPYNTGAIHPYMNARQNKENNFDTSLS
jgi:hypothetical protein